jgi:DNA-binding transcriptional ArsR family regulator
MKDELVARSNLQVADPHGTEEIPGKRKSDGRHEDPLEYRKSRKSFDGRRMDMKDRVLELARAVAVPSRLHLLRSLGETGLSITEAASVTQLATSTTHHHLKVLVQAGLASRRRRGRQVIHRWGDIRWVLRGEATSSAAAAEIGNT